jgi:hypothetical protein
MGEIVSLAKFKRDRDSLILRDAGYSLSEIAQYRVVDEFVERWGGVPRVDHRDRSHTCNLVDLPVLEAATIVAVLDRAAESIAEVRSAGLVFWSPRRSGVCFAAIYIEPEKVQPWRFRAVDKVRITFPLPIGHAGSEALVVVRVESPTSWLPDPEVA